MPQAIHIENLGGLHQQSLWQRLSLFATNCRSALLTQSDLLLNLAVSAMAKRRSNAMPARFDRINRHTWRRYSALLVARDELVESTQTGVAVIDEAVTIKEVSVPVKQRVSVTVTQFTAQPIWASANHDWQQFEQHNG